MTENSCKLHRAIEAHCAEMRSFQRNQRDSSFLRLPSEVRNTIYFLVASGPIEIVRIKKVNPHHCQEPNLCPQEHYRLIKSNAGLAVTCRQIRHDMWKVCAVELPTELILPELPLPLLTIFNLTGFTQCTQIETLRFKLSGPAFQKFLERTDLAPETWGRHWWRASDTLWGLKRMAFPDACGRVIDTGTICGHLNMADLDIEYI
jgi:hypothetical protein